MVDELEPKVKTRMEAIIELNKEFVGITDDLNTSTLPKVGLYMHELTNPKAFHDRNLWLTMRGEFKTLQDTQRYWSALGAAGTQAEIDDILEAA